MLDCLPKMCKAMSIIPTTVKKNHSVGNIPKKQINKDVKK